MNSQETSKKADEIEARRARIRAVQELSAKQAEERLRGVPLPPHRQVRLPNYEVGPMRPLPIKINFYCINDPYPEYLLCQYDVEEKNYDLANESKWFRDALRQIRKSGQKKFPPLKWVAITIFNRGEHRRLDNVEHSYKVGAIFDAAEVFNSSSDFSKMIENAAKDRHPFKFDRTQPTPGEQQRWMIVERHALRSKNSSGGK